MNKDEILDGLKVAESTLNIKLPNKYKQFSSEEIKDMDTYDIQPPQGDTVYLYNYKDLVERNETYTIQDVEPDYLLIGQDGDLGYFINVKDSSELVYSLDLGALGSMDMDEEAKDIYKLRT
ncbi:SMI1/KNR4 family protein [Pantoea ananatis]|uniref:SMI1/KNR4 family protein n=1 Tax=Pantoea ananas TaxID=553 RepID=UPI001FF26255|nr:SMI1/KNR4 family protein [Pantoea ananatis]MCK0552680.1 SMI1/KNR4 family protein [Pantoea ananatis]